MTCNFVRVEALVYNTESLMKALRYSIGIWYAEIFFVVLVVYDSVTLLSHLTRTSRPMSDYQ